MSVMHRSLSYRRLKIMRESNDIIHVLLISQKETTFFHLILPGLWTVLLSFCAFVVNVECLTFYSGFHVYNKEKEKYLFFRK